MNDIGYFIVDDNVDSATSLALAVEMCGHDTECAFDGNSAMAIAPVYKPHILLLDIGLPDMDGYELCRQMRTQEFARHSLFIAQTGWGQESDRLKAERAGFHHHLIKPVEIEQLRKIINDFGS